MAEESRPPEVTPTARQRPSDGGRRFPAGAVTLRRMPEHRRFALAGTTSLNCSSRDYPRDQRRTVPGGSSRMPDNNVSLPGTHPNAK